MIQRRTAIGEAERVRRSLAAQQALIASDWFRQARTIVLYSAFRGEVLTQLIAAAAGAVGKRLALPRVQKQPRRLLLHAYSGDPATLAQGAYGIAEPQPDWPLVELGEVDLVVVPGVAFDRRGNRLGYGGGYYDRLLPEVKTANPAAALAGLAYGFQLVPALPAEHHDTPMDAVATEDGLLRFGGGLPL